MWNFVWRTLCETQNEKHRNWKSENLKLKAKIERIENLRKWNCKLKSPALFIFTVGHHDQNSAKHQTPRRNFHTGLYDSAWKIEIRPWIKSLYMKNTEQKLWMKNTRHQNRTYKSQFYIISKGGKSNLVREPSHNISYDVETCFQGVDHVPGS